MDKIKLKNIIEAILLASDRILSLSQIEKMLTEKKPPAHNKSSADELADESAVEVALAANDEAAVDAEAETETEALSEEHNEAEVIDEPESVNLKNSIKEIIENLQQDYTGRAMELKEVASGYRFQVRQEYADNVSKLWEERPAKYSRALLETLVLIAYRQPITRGEIEAIRGVSVSSHIIKTLVEREWVRVIGHRDVPGKPSIYGSTKEFLDYFNLKSLDELPSLAEISDLDKIAPELALNEKADELQAALKEAATTAEMVAETAQSRRKIQVRRMRRVRRLNLTNVENVESDQMSALNEKAGEPDAALKEPETAEISRKIQVRRMRRMRRNNLMSAANAQSDQSESNDTTTSQVNEQDEVELS